MFSASKINLQSKLNPPILVLKAKYGKILYDYFCNFIKYIKPYISVKLYILNDFILYNAY